MNKASLYLLGLLAFSPLAAAQTDEIEIFEPADPVIVEPAKPAPTPRPVARKPVVKPAPAPATPTPAASQVPTATPPTTPAAAAAAPAVVNVLTAAPVATIEQRRQQELLANAERLDKANRELLARKQELELQYENLAIQNNKLRLDRSNEGIWKGASAVIVGFLMGWFFASIGRRKSNW